MAVCTCTLFISGFCSRGQTSSAKIEGGEGHPHIKGGKSQFQGGGGGQINLKKNLGSFHTCIMLNVCSYCVHNNNYMLVEYAIVR